MLHQVHAIFGYTLMSAGLARIIEVSFIVPKFAPLDGPATDGDNHSEHTLADSGKEDGTGIAGAAKTFRHLPPFVSPRRPDSETLIDGGIRPTSCSYLQGMF